MFERIGSLVPVVVIAAAAVATGAHAVSGFHLGRLDLQFQNLAVLDEGVEGHYEGWAVVNGAPVSTGKFNVDEAGMPVELGGGSVIDMFDAGTNISNASAIKITIEPPGDVDAVPSGLVILTGDVVGRTADLVAAVPGLETLESMTTGAFILATPSDNAVDSTNNDMGIWYLTMPGPAAGLTNLPDPGASWRYEGWVVDVSDPMNPVPYSTGRFSSPSGADDNAAGCMGGGPPFPGQDFTAFHCDAVLDLDNGDFVTVLTIEPEPDNLPGPFQLKPLAGAVPTNALGMNNAMSNQTTATFPTGEAKLSRLRAFRAMPKNGGEMSAASTEESSWGEVKGLFR
jgi:hypothetical protein